jgi:hypothetical protein
MEKHWSTGAVALAVVLGTVGTMIACSDDSTAPDQSVSYIAQLKGANEVPALGVTGTGTATFTLTGKSLSYRVTVSGLTGNAAASHIHMGAAGVNGNILVPFNAAPVQNGEVASGIIDLTRPISDGQSGTITGDQLLDLLNRGMLYTNVHTAAHPGGELRGQITKVVAGGGNGGGSGSGSGGGNGGGGGYGGGNGGGGGVY